MLPYFLTMLTQSVHGYSAPQTGAAFLVPSLVIAAGTQLGERMTTRIGLRTTLLTGFAIGAAGTAVTAIGFDADAGYGLLVSLILPRVSTPSPAPAETPDPAHATPG